MRTKPCCGSSARLSYRLQHRSWRTNSMGDLGEEGEGTGCPCGDLDHKVSLRLLFWRCRVGLGVRGSLPCSVLQPYAVASLPVRMHAAKGLRLCLCALIGVFGACDQPSALHQALHMKLMPHLLSKVSMTENLTPCICPFTLNILTGRRLLRMCYSQAGTTAAEAVL